MAAHRPRWRAGFNHGPSGWKCRAEANRRGIPSTGTLGVLRAAALRGLLDLAPALTRLAATNFRVSQALLEDLLWCGAQQQGAQARLYSAQDPRSPPRSPRSPSLLQLLDAGRRLGTPAPHATLVAGAWDSRTPLRRSKSKKCQSNPISRNCFQMNWIETRRPYR